MAGLGRCLINTAPLKNPPKPAIRAISQETPSETLLLRATTTTKPWLLQQGHLPNHTSLVQSYPQAMPCLTINPGSTYNTEGLLSPWSHTLAAITPQYLPLQVWT